MIKKRLLIIYSAILLLAPLTVYLSITRVYPGEWNLFNILSFIQRSAALIAFIMLSTQLALGEFMERLTEKFGSWVFDYHRYFGIVIYSLIITHTLSFLLMTFVSSKIIDPFYIFTDICLMCEVESELFFSMARLSFWFLTFTILVALLRNRPELRKNWRFFHGLNYIVFILVSLHSIFNGSDIMSITFLPVFILFQLIGLYAIFYKTYHLFTGNFVLKIKK